MSLDQLDEVWAAAETAWLETTPGGGHDIPYPPAWADPAVTAETFDHEAYLNRFDRARLDTDPGYRRAATRRDPLLFALLYVPQHLKSDATDGRITFSDAHLDWCRRALTWLEPVAQPRADRRAEVAPRETGKTTWHFLILPMWGGAHGHIRFPTAFANSTGQAETHLLTFKREQERNQLLREDYPDLCAPARRQSGTTVADRQGMLHARNGFTFAARGIDSSNLGLKVGEVRPDLILLDDIEPDEASYSSVLAHKRLGTVIDAILPMNLWARVILVGTVTMPGSIVHQLVRAAAGEPPEDWIADERFVTHHAKPIVTRDDGSERSIWPAKWPLDMLEEIRHTRSYKKNMDNDPVGVDGGYWTEDDFRYDKDLAVTGQVMSIDPAVTTKKTSDYTGLSIVGIVPGQVGVNSRGRSVQLPARIVVEEAWELRLTGDPLRTHVLKLLERYPLVRAVYIETNQGGDNWHAVLHDLPVRLLTKHQTVKKEIRAQMALVHYQRGRVLHRRRLVRLEQQMAAFPKAPHDDLVDSVVQIALRLLGGGAKQGKSRAEFPR